MDRAPYEGRYHGMSDLVVHSSHVTASDQTPSERVAEPYAVYDIADNAGWVSVGIDNDTASFAVNSIRRWCQRAKASRMTLG
jgi:hypothetical protein